jgi:hypothetical protein
MDAFISSLIGRLGPVLAGQGAASDVLDIALGDAEVVQLTLIEGAEFAHGALILSKLGKALTDVHFGSPSF